MSTISVKEIERSRSKTAALDHVAICSANDFRGREICGYASGRQHMRFILVNDRTPRRQSVCVMCDQPIGASYLREVGTHLTYCDHDCYADHCERAFLLLENRARAS